MLRAVKTTFKATKKNINKLFEANKVSAQVWNDILQLSKDYAIQNNGKWISKSELQKLLKGKYPLHSQSI